MPPLIRPAIYQSEPRTYPGKPGNPLAKQECLLSSCVSLYPRLRTGIRPSTMPFGNICSTPPSIEDWPAPDVMSTFIGLLGPFEGPNHPIDVYNIINPSVEPNVAASEMTGKYSETASEPTPVSEHLQRSCSTPTDGPSKCCSITSQASGATPRRSSLDDIKPSGRAGRPRKGHIKREIERRKNMSPSAISVRPDLCRSVSRKLTLSFVLASEGAESELSKGLSRAKGAPYRGTGEKPCGGQRNHL